MNRTNKGISRRRIHSFRHLKIWFLVFTLMLGNIFAIPFTSQAEEAGEGVQAVSTDEIFIEDGYGEAEQPDREAAPVESELLIDAVQNNVIEDEPSSDSSETGTLPESEIEVVTEETCGETTEQEDIAVAGIQDTANEDEEASGYYHTITATASDGAAVEISGDLPAGATVSITPVPFTGEQLIRAFGKDKAEGMKGYVAYDISIMAYGREWQPSDGQHVSVAVSKPDMQSVDDENKTDETDTDTQEQKGQLGVAHIDGASGVTKEVTVSSAGSDAVTFEADGFSVYVFYTLFTVDFYYGDSQYHMQGFDRMTLSQLFKELGIERNIADVADASFTTEEYLKVVRCSELDTAVATDSNADPSLSADHDPHDFMLISRKAFNTYEMLTVIMNDGSELIINVTDDVVHLYDYSKDSIPIDCQDFHNLVYKNSSSYNKWKKTESANAPDGFPYVYYVEHGIMYPTGSSDLYNVYCASPKSEAFSYITETGGGYCLNCINSNCMVCFWVENDEGEKLFFDDLCIGNQGSAALWFWRFDLGMGTCLYTNDTNLKYTKNKGTQVSKEGRFQGVLANTEGYYYAILDESYDEISAFQIHGVYADITIKKQVIDELAPDKLHTGSIKVSWCDEEGALIPDELLPAEAKLIIPSEDEKNNQEVKSVSFPFSQSENFGVVSLGTVRPVWVLGETGYVRVEEVINPEDKPLSVSPSSHVHFYKIQMKTTYPTITYIGTSMK